ncbi:MAG: NINE protein [Saprospiraceae bacterium]|nr:NINE protein [Saprospiraceae bacterium]
MTTNRRLAAIMFTDITGFSALMQSSEAQAKILRSRHRSVFRDSHDRYKGQILQYFGDGTLSIFDSAAAAVECAVEMQIEFRKEPVVPLRIGIHTGDISYDEEGAYGDGLNIASRVENLSIPGSVFITAKVYDDIKNHSWLTAVSLGFFKLRNILSEIEILAVNCKGLSIPDEAELATYPELTNDAPLMDAGAVPGSQRSKWLAGTLALLFGVLGVHRFYLGKRLQGILYLFSAFVGLMMTVEGEFPGIAVVGVVAFIDSLVLYFMPQHEFDRKYNAGRVASTVPTPLPKREKKKRRRRQTKQFGPIKKALRLYDQGKFREAVQAFDRILENEPDNIIAHFYLACCFSIFRDKQDAFFHLSQSVSLGFDDFERIEDEEALSFLRAQPEYNSYRANGYRLVESLPPPQPDLLDATDRFNPDVLVKIEILGDRMERGELSREQFEIEKRKLLDET